MFKYSRLASLVVAMLLAAGPATSAFDRAIDNSARRVNARRRAGHGYPRVTEEQRAGNKAVDAKNAAQRARRYAKKAGE